MASTIRTTSRTSRVDGLVDATPPSRDRYVDFLRAASIAVVVLWHWVFSVTHWTPDGRLTMPNPIADTPGLWAATWLLQVMPVFFLVGGFSNLTGWTSARRGGRGDVSFLRTRMARLLRPIAAFVAVWTVAEALRAAFVPGAAAVWHWGAVVFVPLWFIGVYAGVVALVPLSARLHRRAPRATVVALGASIVAVDGLRFAAGMTGVGIVNGALVFLFAHQLGYFYADGTLLGWSRRRLGLLTAGGLAALAALTAFGPYPASMVATEGGRFSNMNPPTLPIACLAVFQLGVAMLCRPAVSRWLQRRRPWSVVIAANSVIMTVFAWHMTALVLAIGLVEALGGELGTRATGAWWAERPLWLMLPAVLLVPLVRSFVRFERAR